MATARDRRSNISKESPASALAVIILNCTQWITFRMNRTRVILRREGTGDIVISPLDPFPTLTSFDCWIKTTLLREIQFTTQQTAARKHDAISWNARQIQLEDRNASGIFLGCGYLQNDQFAIRMLCLR